MADNFDTETFTYNGHGLRKLVIDGAPWLVAVDVIRAMGMVVGNKGAANNLQILDKDEKVVRPVVALESFEGKQVRKGGNPRPNTTLISESGFYKLTMRAQRTNPAAREFQDWVTKDVLPSIRKDGAYVMGEEKLAAGAVVWKVNYRPLRATHCQSLRCSRFPAEQWTDLNFRLTDRRGIMLRSIAPSLRVNVHQKPVTDRQLRDQTPQ